jgi:hypothetical protein
MSVALLNGRSFTGHCGLSLQWHYRGVTGVEPQRRARRCRPWKRLLLLLSSFLRIRVDDHEIEGNANSHELLRGVRNVSTSVIHRSIQERTMPLTGYMALLFTAWHTSATKTVTVYSSPEPAVICIRLVRRPEP